MMVVAAVASAVVGKKNEISRDSAEGGRWSW
jgi:hypothetical protein